MQDSLVEQPKPPIELPEAQKRAIDILGTTENPNEGAFILLDGRMVKLKIEEGNVDSLYHSYGTDAVFPESTTSLSDFIETGAIRIGRPVSEIGKVAQICEFTEMPTPQQVARLKQLATDTDTFDADWRMSRAFKGAIPNKLGGSTLHHKGPGAERALIRFIMDVRRKYNMANTIQKDQFTKGS